VLKTQRRNESKDILVVLICDHWYFGIDAQHSPILIACNGVEVWGPMSYEMIVARLSETAFTFIAALGCPPIGSGIC